MDSGLLCSLLGPQDPALDGDFVSERSPLAIVFHVDLLAGLASGMAQHLSHVAGTSSFHGCSSSSKATCTALQEGSLVDSQGWTKLPCTL